MFRDPPFGGMERAPTEGGVITPHPGIAGVGDVGATFGWTEPTATVTVEAVVEMPEMPAEPVDFEVMLTNLTMGAPGQGGQIFSPPIFVTHGHGFSIGASGELASMQLGTLAEAGKNGPLAELAMGSDAVGSVVAFPAASRRSGDSRWGPSQQRSAPVLMPDTSHWRRCLCKPTTASFWLTVCRSSTKMVIPVRSQWI